MIFTWIKDELRRRGEDGWYKGQFDAVQPDGSMRHCIVGWIRTAESALNIQCEDCGDVCISEHSEHRVAMARALKMILIEDSAWMEDAGAEILESDSVEGLNDNDATSFDHIMQAVEILADEEEIASKQVEMLLAGAGTEQLAPAGPASQPGSLGGQGTFTEANPGDSAPATVAVEEQELVLV